MSLILSVTIQETVSFRNLTSKLAKIVKSSNLIINQKNDDKNKVIKMYATDSEKTSVVIMNLYNGIQVTTCKKRTLLGIDWKLLKQIINNVHDDEIIMLNIYDNDPTLLQIQILDNTINKKSTFELQLLNLEDISFELPSVMVDNVVNTFPEIIYNSCEEINKISSKVNIICSDDVLKFKSVDNEKVQKIIKFRNTETNEIHVSHSSHSKDQKNYNCIFDTEKILAFKSLGNLSHIINIFFKEDYPLVIKHYISSLCSIYVCISPVTN